jgi:hypothetical protein
VDGRRGEGAVGLANDTLAFFIKIKIFSSFFSQKSSNGIK